jgi:hypothetical protein
MVPVAFLFLASVFPRVEDPWPDTIGLEFPFTAAGIGGVLAGVIYARAREEERNEATGTFGLYGFCLGAVFYALSLLNQVVSGL